MTIGVQGQEGNPYPAPWWLADKYDSSVNNRVFELVFRLNRFQSYRRDTNIKCLRMYAGASYMNFSPYSYMRGTIQYMSDDRPKYNVVSSCVDTVFSRVAKNNPRLLALTERGDDTLRRRAQKLTQFTLGMMKQTGGYARAKEAFKDGQIFDVGIVKLCREDDSGRMYFERVFPNEIYVDETDAFYGSPSHIHQAKYILKDKLKELYPAKYHLAIDQATNAMEGEGQFASNTDTRYAVVIESWHLPSAPGAKDGRHTICVSNQVLFDEVWKKDHLPFAFSRWTNPMVGFWGQSLAYRLMGKQVEINKMLKIIQDSMHLGSAFKVFVEHGSRVAQEHLSNALGSIVYYTGTPPQYTVPQTVHQEYFTHLKWLIDASYQEAGISALSAQSKKPAGLDAAVAMREYQDIESERFATIAQSYDDLHIEMAKMILRECKEMAEEGVKLEVKAESKKFVETIKWKDVEIDENEMVLQLFPTSMLPHDPAGRIQYVTELMQGGLINQDIGLSLLDFPDVEAAIDVQTAPTRDIEFTIGEILEKGEYNPPEPYQNLELGLKLFQSHYLLARANGVSEDRLEMLRNWMNSAKALKDQQQQQQMQMQMATQAQAQASPMIGGAAPAAESAPQATPPGAPQQ